jgi:uncharacterized protein YndB with AHSA1/START domain
MEHGSIEREMHIDAAPEIVFEVISDPAHVRNWWPDEANYEVAPGVAGEIVFIGPTGERTPVAFEVVDAIAPRLFAFRWTHGADEPPVAGNSMLVVFELEPAGAGTTLRMTETGFRERGWEAAVLEETFRDHEQGWDHFMARLAAYAGTVRGVRR